MRQRRTIGLVAVAVFWVSACGGSNGSTVGVNSTLGATTSAPDTTSLSLPTTTSAGTTTTTSPGQHNTTIAPQAPNHATTTSTPGYTTSTQAPATTTTTQKRRLQVKLPTGGVRGPVDPPNTPAYELLTAGGNGCRQLLDTISASWGDPVPPDDPAVTRVDPKVTYLYRAAAEACLLDFANAKADLGRFYAINPIAFADTCPDPAALLRYCERCHRLVLEWVSQQVAAYKLDQSYAPEIVADASGAPAPCPPDTTTTVS